VVGGRLVGSDEEAIDAPDKSQRWISRSTGNC